MAEIVKPKDIAKILENIPENQIANAAQELGVKPEQLTKFVNKPTGKAFEKIAETLGEGLEGAQKFVDKFLQRETPTPPPPSKPLALPPAATEPAPALPAVVTPPGPLSPRMQSLGSKAQKGVIDVEPIPTKPALPAGQMSQTPTQQALEAATAPKQPEMTPVPKKAKAGAAAAGLGALALSAGFSKQANAPTAIQAAQVDKIEDVQDLADKAEAQGAVTPEQKAVFTEQTQQVAKASESLEKILRDEYRRDKARVELMQLIETVANGLVTAIGANALLSRGSPYAVDFSKGPKTDWAGQFDRLQKDFKIQMDALNEKYKLEAQEKREAERAATQKSQFEQSQALKREAMGIREKQAQVAQTAQEETKRENLQAKLQGTLEKINAPEITPAALISQAGMLNTQARQLLGEAGYAELKKEAAKIAKEDAGIFEKGWNAFLSLVGKDAGKETKAEHKRRIEAMATLLQKKLEEGIPTTPAAPAAAPADDDAKRRRLEELRAKKSGG